MNNEEMWDHVRQVTKWLDDNSKVDGSTNLLRIMKVSEEVGEVTAAVIGVTGQNPRKGLTHTWEDVRTELCDVILAAMVALNTISEWPEDIFADHVKQRHTRILALKSPVCACCGGEFACEDETGNWCGNCVGRCAPGEGMGQ